MLKHLSDENRDISSIPKVQDFKKKTFSKICHGLLYGDSTVMHYKAFQKNYNVFKNSNQ